MRAQIKFTMFKFTVFKFTRLSLLIHFFYNFNELYYFQGSDASSLKTTARREGDFYVLNGKKADSDKKCFLI